MPSSSTQLWLQQWQVAPSKFLLPSASIPRVFILIIYAFTINLHIYGLVSLQMWRFEVSPPLWCGQFLLGHLDWCLGVWSVSPHLWMLGHLIGVQSVSPHLSVLGFEMSPLVCWCLVIWLGFEVSPPIYGCWVIWLGFEVSCRSNMGLWCCSSGVASMLTGFSTVMGVSLSVGLRFSLQPSFESWPNSPLMTGLIGLIKVKSPSTSIIQPNKHT